MACWYYVPFQGHYYCSFRKPTVSSSHKPILKEVQQVVCRVDVVKTVKNTCIKLLDAFVDSAFEFVDYPFDPSQTNADPVDELREAAFVTNIQGIIPIDFPQGLYITNGPNPKFGGLKSTKSIFGKSGPLWVEGEGMLHVLYFSKHNKNNINNNNNNNENWSVIYNNRYVETDTFKLEKLRNKPSFLPAIQGDLLAVFSSCLLNLLRFGKPFKNTSNTNVFEHSGKLYSIVENDLPQEIDMFTLEALGDWDVNGAWKRPFTAHPKKVPDTGELVTMGTSAIKPFVELGVISADGKKLVHKLDLKLDRCPLCHEIGVTMRYTVFMDCPITVDVNRLIHGGQLIKYESEGYARIGIIPRYGDADSIHWFNVKPNCTFHIINCFEDGGDEVVVWGCRALASVIPGPEPGSKKFEWFPSTFKPGPGKPIEDVIPEDQLLFPRPYEWRLNLQTGDVKEKYLIGPNHFPMEFPIINGGLTGLRNKYSYTQVGNCDSSSATGMGRFSGLAKLYFEEQVEGSIKVEYHMFEKKAYCSGAAFVPKQGGIEEDDGWIITFVHHEDTDISQAYIIDAKSNFSSKPVAKMTLPARVPDCFHGAFLAVQLQSIIARIIPEI